jgi:hypothetical protein
MNDPARPPPLSAYHRRLFFFLGVAGFFEGFDAFAFTQILPTLPLNVRHMIIPRQLRDQEWKR